MRPVGLFFDTHQLDIRFNFDVNIKILLNFDVDGTNVKTAKGDRSGSGPFHTSVLLWSTSEKFTCCNLNWQISVFG